MKNGLSKLINLEELDIDFGFKEANTKNLSSLED